MDENLRTASLLLRSLGDLTFILHIVHLIRKAVKLANHDFRMELRCRVPYLRYWKTYHLKMYAHMIFKAFPKRSVISDFLALLPIPQMLILVVFFKIKGTGRLDNGFILNVLLLAQFFPRIYRTHLLSVKIANASRSFLARVLFFLFLYAIASHVGGGFWYFSAVQREMQCWHQACVKHNTCKSTFYCDGSSSRNITLLNESCPINSPDATVFDFGIFLDSLQSNNKSSTRFQQRFFFSLWWGMRNLSSFGQNLVTSNHVWDNVFAISISVCLPLLFYLIGTSMQQHTKMVEKRSKIPGTVQLGLRMWMSRNHVPTDLRKDIIADVTRILEDDIVADVENLFKILPWRTKKSLKRFLCFRTLVEIPRLVCVEDKVLSLMCDYLKPVIYPENSYIIRSGEPLDFILLVGEGVVWTFNDASSSVSRYLEKGGVYGDEQLLSWASAGEHFSFTGLPIVSENVKSHSKVHGFVLMAKDLKTVVYKCKYMWCWTNRDELKEMAATAISRRIKHYLYRRRVMISARYGGCEK